MHNLDQILDRVVGALVCRRDAFPHQLSHGVLWRLAVRELSDSGQDVVFLGLLHVLVGFDETEIRRLAKVFLKSFRRDRLAGPMDEVEGGRSIFSQFLDDWCFAMSVVIMEIEASGSRIGAVLPN